MASHRYTLFSETTRCARQQRWALLFFLLLSLLNNYCLYTPRRWVPSVPTVESLKILFSLAALGYLLSQLLIMIPWLLLTQATLQHRTITLPCLIRRTRRLFPKLAAIQVINCSLMMILALIPTIFLLIASVLLLGLTEKITAPSGLFLPNFLLELPHCYLWIVSILLPSVLLTCYFHCRLLFTTYIVVTEPQATLLTTLRLSWQWSKPCQRQLLVAKLLLGLLLFIPIWGVQIAPLGTNPWVTIGLTLYSSALELLDSLYFFVLYRQQKALPEQPLYLSKR